MISRLLTHWLTSPGAFTAPQLRVALAMGQHGAGTIEAIAQHTGLSRRTVARAVQQLVARSPILGFDPTRPLSALRASSDAQIAAALGSILNALMIGALTLTEGRVAVAACLWSPVTLPALAAGLRLEMDYCRMLLRAVQAKGLMVPVQRCAVQLRPAPRPRVLRVDQAQALGQTIVRQGLTPAVLATLQRQTLAA